MRRMLFKSLVHGPLTEAAPAADEAALAELAAQLGTTGTTPARAHALDTRGRCRFLQWLRA